MSPLSPDAQASGGSDRRGRAPLDWARAEGAEALVERAMQRGVRRRTRRRLIAAAAVAGLAVVLALPFWRPAAVPGDAGPAVLPAFVSAPQRQILPDGSIAELNTGAAIEVRFSDGVRRVALAAGEAHFDVRKDPARPFVVVARGVEVRAVGTAFAVRLDSTAVDVLVTEGRVAVVQTEADSGASAPILLAAGQGLALSADASRQSDAPVMLDATEFAGRLGWRVPRLELNYTPLSDVLPVVNAHAESPLVLGDAALGNLQLSGTLRASNVPVLLGILETSFGVKARRNERGELVLTRTP